MLLSAIERLKLHSRLRLPPERAVHLLTVGAIAAIFCVTALLLWDLREREKRHAQGEIVSLSKILADQTARAFEGVDLVLRGVHDRLTDGIGQKLQLDSQMVYFLLRARVTSLPQVASVFVINPEGMVVNSSRGAGATGRSVRERPFFAVWREGYAHDLFVGRPSRSPIDGRWSLYLSRQLLDDKGAFRGVVVANVDLGYFESLYQSISLDFVSPIFLMLADGSVLVSQPPDDKLVGDKAFDLTAASHPAGADSDLRLIVEPGRRTVAYRSLSQFPLAVGVAIGEAEALTPWRAVAWRIATGAVLVSLAIILAGGVVTVEIRREKRLLEALQDSNRQLRELSSAMQEVRENERTRIARELHDELGQKLTGLKLELSWLASKMRKLHPEFGGKIEDMQRLLVDTIEETRRISTELRPLMLDDLGFAAAAEWMLQKFSQRTGIVGRLNLEAADEVHGDPLATTLFRVLQESLTNVVRHAGASEVDVLLRRIGDKLILSVQDNGRGLVDLGEKRSGFGLIGMRERVSALGGTLRLDSRAGGGCLLEAVIPLVQGEAVE